MAQRRRAEEVSVAFEKILLPVDLSDRHGGAVEAAARLAKQSDGEVTLLHVVEVLPGLPRKEESAFYGRLEKKAQAHLKGIAKRLSKLKVPCRTIVTYGHRAREVVEQAEALPADLIVLTVPEVNGRNPAAWGSLSWKIAVLCHCPVLLVK
jgi:nucleotide-binding universal stress UspA family protein